MEKTIATNAANAALIVQAVNEHAALAGLEKSIRDMKHDIDLFYAKYRESSNPYLTALNKSLDAVTAVRKGVA